MDVEYHPATVSELNSARDYYNELTSGLGDEFKSEVMTKIDFLLANPLVCKEENGVRRAFLKRFPFSVLYRTDGEGFLRVLCIRHHRRHPAYGSGRT